MRPIPCDIAPCNILHEVLWRNISHQSQGKPILLTKKCTVYFFTCVKQHMRKMTITINLLVWSGTGKYLLTLKKIKWKGSLAPGTISKHVIGGRFPADTYSFFSVHKKCSPWTFTSLFLNKTTSTLCKLCNWWVASSPAIIDNKQWKSARVPQIIRTISLN